MYLYGEGWPNNRYTASRVKILLIKINTWTLADHYYSQISTLGVPTTQSRVGGVRIFNTGVRCLLVAGIFGTYNRGIRGIFGNFRDAAGSDRVPKI